MFFFWRIRCSLDACINLHTCTYMYVYICIHIYIYMFAGLQQLYTCVYLGKNREEHWYNYVYIHMFLGIYLCVLFIHNLVMSTYVFSLWSYTYHIIMWCVWFTVALWQGQGQTAQQVRTEESNTSNQYWNTLVRRADVLWICSLQIYGKPLVLSLGQHANTLGIYCSQTCFCFLAIGKNPKSYLIPIFFGRWKKHRLRDVQPLGIIFSHF